MSYLLKVSAVLLLSLVLTGCVTPAARQKTSSTRMSRICRGMTVQDVKHIVGRPGEPVYLISDAHQYECRKYVVNETNVPYYFLWVDDYLTGVVSAEGCRFVEKTSAITAGPQGLPHERGFESILAPFESSQAPEEMDFSAALQGFSTRSERREQARAEWIMWSPIIVLSLPALPLTIPLALIDKSTTTAALASAYKLRTGMEAGAVEKLVGKPEYQLGDVSQYGVNTYHVRPADGEAMLVSAGFRGRRTVWIRFGYDAFADYTGTSEPGD